MQTIYYNGYKTLLIETRDVKLLQSVEPSPEKTEVYEAIANARHQGIERILIPTKKVFSSFDNFLKHAVLSFEIRFCYMGIISGSDNQESDTS
ncbi:MAG: hypothetical protein ACTSPB_01310 [Candidatus Thorarchaeota archaeon]